jgi:hypothetical protein
MPCRIPHLIDRKLYSIRIGVDRSEHRFKAEGHVRDLGRPQSHHPRIPEAAVAEEPMDKQHTGSGRVREPIRLRVESPGLTPAEDLRRAEHFAPPSTDDLDQGWPKAAVLSAVNQQECELECQYPCVSECEGKSNADDNKSRNICRRKNQPSDDRRDQREYQ